MSAERARAILITVSILVLMSLGTILNKMALSTIAPLTLTWTSILVGMSAMTIYTFGIRRERVPKMDRRIWLYIVIIGVGNFVVGRIAGTAALSLMPATTNAYLTNFIGFLTMIMSIFILKESPTVFQVLGALIAIFGLRIFFQEIPPPSELLGVVLVFVGITGVALTNNIARKLAIETRNSISNNVVSTLAILIGGSITVVVGLLVDHPLDLGGPRQWGVILYAGLVTTALGLTVWNSILRVLRSYEASILGASTIIWTAILAIPLLGERLALNQVAGIALMLAGLILVQVRVGRFSTIAAWLGR
ncbi:MAG: DMT family transporter, partial [Caldilineaceae bacterium]